MSEIALPKGRLKAEDIRVIVNAKLAECGFERRVYRWKLRPRELEILINGAVRTLSFRSGMSKKNLRYELARLDAWADFMCRKRGLKPQPKFEVQNEQQIDLEELTG